MTTTLQTQTRSAGLFSREFFHTYRFQISIIGLLVVLYAIFIIAAPRTYLSFNIYRSFMISIPFFGLMAMSATFVWKNPFDAKTFTAEERIRSRLSFFPGPVRAE